MNERTQRPQDMLVSQYVEARQAWRYVQRRFTLRVFAQISGMSERQYCDSYVGAMPLIFWTDTEVGRLDPDAAFETAGRLIE